MFRGSLLLELNYEHNRSPISQLPSILQVKLLLSLSTTIWRHVWEVDVKLHI